MVKSMVEYLYWSGAHEAPRKARFPDQFTDDLSTLVTNVTAEIIAKYEKSLYNIGLRDLKLFVLLCMYIRVILNRHVLGFFYHN